MKKSVKMLLVDDHDVVRQGLKFILRNQETYNFDMMEASSRETCLEACRDNDFDIILMDVNLGKDSGVDLTRELLKQDNSRRIIALTMHEDEYIIHQMVNAGVTGYLLKNTGGEELTRAIQTVLSGESYYTNRVALTLLQKRSNPKKDNMAVLVESLSPREKEILRLIVDEMTNEEIANKLFLSKRTVDGHRQKLIGKLGVRNTAGLVKFAIEANLL